MITHKIDWTQFKSEVSSRSMSPQWVDANSSYYIYGRDGFITFSCEIFQNEISTGDQLDFETNYKSIWNKQLSFTDPSGIQQVIPSARPAGTTTFFTGEGDNGNKLEFELTVNDASISRDLTFNEDIWIKDGGMICVDAPFGAYFNVDVVHPQYGIVAKFCRRVPLYGNNTFLLNSEDKSLITQGLTLRVTVFNSSTPVAFRASGWLEGFRATMT